MKTVVLRPAEPEHDFAQIAAWFSILENEPNSERHLKEYFQGARDRIVQVLAEGDQGRRLGFGWLVRDRLKLDLAYLYIYVEPGLRGQGIGSQMYTELLNAAAGTTIRRLTVKVKDTDGEGQTFAGRRGFVKKAHEIEQVLELDAFDDELYEDVIAQLQSEGFQFTSMEELGNTPEAQRKLYVLNDETAMDMPGPTREHAWNSFEEFQQAVCESAWYKPGGQIVAIDTATGKFAAMCAVTCFDAYDSHATILHLGVDQGYRGRNLGQAVSVLALRYARDGLKAGSVYTYHDASNAPAIAIDTQLGYIQVDGMISMEKKLG